jgi:hypothetical protein
MFCMGVKLGVSRQGKNVVGVVEEKESSGQ